MRGVHAQLAAAPAVVTLTAACNFQRIPPQAAVDLARTPWPPSALSSLRRSDAAATQVSQRPPSDARVAVFPRILPMDVAQPGTRPDRTPAPWTRLHLTQARVTGLVGPHLRRDWRAGLTIRHRPAAWLGYSPLPRGTANPRPSLRPHRPGQAYPWVPLMRGAMGGARCSCATSTYRRTSPSFRCECGIRARTRRISCTSCRCVGAHSLRAHT